MKEVTRVERDATSFRNGCSIFSVAPKSKNMTVWKLHKRFGCAVDYRVLLNIDNKIPVGVQRLREKKAS